MIPQSNPSGPDDSAIPAEPKPEDSTGEKKLSAEEQMEKYEEYLKENDWGHQPC
jgi:hypothetical protein